MSMDNKTKKFANALYFPIAFVVILWIFHFYKLAFLSGYPSLGIYPRETFGLQGILTSPLSHGDFQHLISNSVPLFVTTFIIFYFYRRVAFASFALIYIMTGVAVWLFARPVYHIGASGVVYGLISFIMWSGIFRRNLKSIALSLVIVTMYSGYFYGIVPNEDGISWESHLFGAVAGVIVAFLFKGLIEKDEINISPWEGDDESVKYLFPRDVFVYTKTQRSQQEESEEDSTAL